MGLSRTGCRGFAVAATLVCLVAAASAATPASGDASLAAPAEGPAAPRAAASNSSRDWWFIPKGAHRRPGVPRAAARLLRRYDGIWIGGRHERIVYLTFDEADELGTTRRIIGILERAHVKASFFLTGPYIRGNRGMVRSLAAHGHLLCNHSWSHANMVVKARSRSVFTHELRATERACRAATGDSLARFFRPPFGTYSARSLQLAEQLGYATVFWSFAHHDYDEGAQPPVSVTLRRIVNAAAPGVVYLLHASSRSNVNVLAKAIHGIKLRGYRFATLDELR
jgi:peptidoglycan-N-acetylmuramic acid deacetylase